MALQTLGQECLHSDTELIEKVNFDLGHPVICWGYIEKKKLQLISEKYLVMAAHSPLLERIEVLCQGGRLENLSYWLIVTNLPVRWSFFPDDSPRF